MQNFAAKLSKGKIAGLTDYDSALTDYSSDSSESVVGRVVDNLKAMADKFLIVEFSN